LVITHGGVIRMLLLLAFDLPLTRLHQWETPLAGLTRLWIPPDGGLVRLDFHLPSPTLSAP
jgi:broad specificity phosphatase PhoE